MNIVTVSLATLLMASGGSQGGAQDAGAKVYSDRCAVCHGEKGQGDGAAARFLYPKPRDFTKGLFKFRSTPEGSLPTDEDLIRTVTQGLPGSAMPSFADLSSEDRAAVVEFLKTFSEKFASQQPKAPIGVEKAPDSSPKRVEQGKQLFVDLDCVKCHGKSGKGDGTSAATLKDDWGFAIRPRDLTSGTYKGGGADEDLYRRIMGGIQGTPMPSFADSIEGEDRWALVSYVKLLAGGTRTPTETASVIQATRVAGDVANDPKDTRWSTGSPANVRLMTLWERGRTVNFAGVCAMHNGKKLAVRVEWDDPEVASNFVAPEQFVDAAAMQFPIGPGLPSFAMGEAGKPVNVWYWRADRELNAAPVTMVSATDGLYPEPSGTTMEGRAIPAKGAAKPNIVEDFRANRDAVYYTGAAAGNPVSVVSTIEELNAEGFGTLTTQPKADQSVRGSGAWVEGKWVVVFTRALGKTGTGDAILEAGGSTPVALAIWDGAQRDRNGQKAVTNWLSLHLAK